MTAIISKIESVRPHGDNLSIVTVMGNEVVANRLPDGSFRWEVGEVCVYVPEGMIIPEDVLVARGYWDEEKKKGLLEGKKGNRVKMRRFAGHESRGLLFKVERTDPSECVPTGYYISRTQLIEGEFGHTAQPVAIGDDVSEFLGIVEHIPG